MKHFDQNLTQETLETYQGYSLQVFTSGRIKLSFHRSHKDRVEYYGECASACLAVAAAQTLGHLTGSPTGTRRGSCGPGRIAEHPAALPLSSPAKSHPGPAVA